MTLMVTRQHIEDFISRHRLPAGFLDLIRESLQPPGFLVHQQHAGAKKPLLVGISGAQGTGKSTLADFLQLVLLQKTKAGMSLFCPLTIFI